MKKLKKWKIYFYDLSLFLNLNNLEIFVERGGENIKIIIWEIVENFEKLEKLEKFKMNQVTN